MDKLEKLMGEYQKALAERQEGWNSNYSPEICEALKHETEIMACELENIVKDKERENKPAVQIGIKNYYQKRQLDETKIIGLNEEEKAVVRFVAESKVPRPSGFKYFEYHNTAGYKDIRKIIFEYWKKENPEKIKEIAKETFFKANRMGRWFGPKKTHFGWVEAKDPKDIKFEDFEDPKYTIHGFVPATRDYINPYIRKLIEKGVLAPGPTQAKVSVPQEFLK